MRSHLTIRNLPSEIAEALEQESRLRRLSINKTVIALLKRALSKEPGCLYDNGLGKLAGTWSKAELKEFEAHTRRFETVDPELWS
jgi:hypothetical protein